MLINEQYLTVPQVLTFGKVGSIAVMCTMIFGTFGNSALLYVTLRGIGRFAFVGSQVALNILVIVVYQKLRSAMMEAKRMSRLGNKETAKVYRAVNTVMICYILGWLTTMVSLGVTMLFTLDVFVTVAVESVVGVFANINLACPLVVYYYRSSLYRNEICRVFGFVKNRIHGQTNSVQPLPQSLRISTSGNSFNQN
ncbi:hypothetical protein QR680_016178 [Steinernema hermaphroditum]|uniref:G-protein coupled receptors family 1 profile domain-containing protein n=1 Tax=Steinernema hermaphroditum TaxID=289476 RepID=A0AA39HAC3_9BILA|nr:hypothetical protein QR680_016178 [Steinernema hermaphroditum]